MTSSHSVNTSKQSHSFATLWCTSFFLGLNFLINLFFFQIAEAEIIALDPKPQVKTKQTVSVRWFIRLAIFYSSDSSPAYLYVQHDPSRVSKILLLNSQLTVRNSATSRCQQSSQVASLLKSTQGAQNCLNLNQDALFLAYHCSQCPGPPLPSIHYQTLFFPARLGQLALSSLHK